MRYLSQDVKTALVIGASRGIGAAVAQNFLAAGYKVAGTHRGSGVPEGVIPILSDVISDDGTADEARIRDTVAEAAAALGVIDTAVYNAGITRDGLLMRMSRQDIEIVLQTNLVAPMLFTQALLMPMMRNKGGSIVLISSVSARYGVKGQTNYTAAKAGLEGFMRSAAKEYGAKGIRINAVAPGVTKTDMFGALSEEEQNAMAAETTLGRIALPEEIASVVRATSEHTYMLGNTVPVSGGAGYGY